MVSKFDANDLYCEKCGAPLLKDTICTYCSDARILAERQELCRDFLDQMNKELEALPGGPGWLILLIWWGTPILVLTGIWIVPGRLNFLIWILLAAAAFFVTTIIAGAMRDGYRRKIFTNRLAGLLDQFLVKNQIAYDYMLNLANKTYPDKAAIRELMAEGKKLEHLL
jgi:hypothetical protein